MVGCAKKNNSSHIEVSLQADVNQSANADSSNRMISFDTTNISFFEQDDSYIIERISNCKSDVLISLTKIDGEEIQDFIFIVNKEAKVIDSVNLNNIIPDETIVSVFATANGTIFVLSLPFSSDEILEYKYSLYEIKASEINRAILRKNDIKFSDGFVASELIAVENDVYVHSQSVAENKSRDVIFYSNFDTDTPFQEVDTNDIKIKEIVSIDNQIAVIEEERIGEDYFVNVIFLEKGKYKSSVQIKANELAPQSFYIGIESNLFYSDYMGINLVDFTKENLLAEQIVSFSNIGFKNNINETNIMFYPFSKTSFFYTSILNLSNGNSGLLIKNQTILLNLSNNPKSVKTITITGKGIQYNSELFLAIQNYNRRSSDNMIEILEYENLNESSFEEQLSIRFISGESPDILFSQGESLDRYYNKGYLVDLYDFIDNESDIKMEDYISNILELSKKNGELFQIFPSFSIFGFACRESLIGEKNSLTFSEFEKLHENAKNNQRLIAYQDSNTLLTYSMFSQLDEFISYDERTAKFLSQEFYDLLSFSKKYGENNPQQDERFFVPETELVINDELLLINVQQLGNPQTLQEYSEAFSEPIQLIGFPSFNVGSPVCVPNMFFSITSDSSEKQASWDFIKSFLSPEMQNELAGRNYIPILKSAFDLQILNATKISNENPLPLSAQNAKNYRKAVESINTISIFDERIFSIVTEETFPYFADQKSDKDVADIIQSRVTTFLNERE